MSQDMFQFCPFHVFHLIKSPFNFFSLLFLNIKLVKMISFLLSYEKW